MTPMEARGLARGGMVLLALAALRLGWDHLRRPAAILEEGPDRSGELLAGSQEAQAREAARSRPLAPGEKVDPNRDGEEALDRLPGIGPGVARAVVLHRQESGGFHGPRDLLEVRGIGDATLEKIRPHLDFSRGLPPELPRSSAGRGKERPEEAPRLTGLSRSGSPSDPAPVDVNRAGPEELQSLPGIGPALAGRIVESREKEGRFRTPEDLLRVRGIGPAILARIRGRLTLQ
jgi:competence protein ComEA